MNLRMEDRGEENFSSTSTGIYRHTTRFSQAMKPIGLGNGGPGLELGNGGGGLGQGHEAGRTTKMEAVESFVVNLDGLLG